MIECGAEQRVIVVREGAGYVVRTPMPNRNMLGGLPRLRGRLEAQVLAGNVAETLDLWLR
jgi:hypothetical protein